MATIKRIVDIFSLFSYEHIFSMEKQYKKHALVINNEIVGQLLVTVGIVNTNNC